MSQPKLIIDGVYFGDLEAADVAQSYTEVAGGVSHRRMADMSLESQCFGVEKIRTTIRGVGWLPPGLDNLDQRTDYTLKCLSPRTISSASNTIPLPSYRSDVPLLYTAWVDDELVDWDGSSVVADVQAYRVTYVPELEVRLTSKTVTGQLNSPEWGWQLVFEET